MGCWWRKPKKNKASVEPQKPAVEHNQTDYDFLQRIKVTTRTSNTGRGKINIRDLLPNNMFKHYERLDLPVSPVNLNSFVSEVYLTLNLLRADPIFFVNNFLETIRSRFQSEETYKSFSNEIRHSTFGLFGVDNCIKYISNMESRSPLYWSFALQAVAEGIISISSGDNNNHSQVNSEDTIELNGIVYEFTQRGSEISFEVITNLIFEDYEEMRMWERLWDANVQFIGIAHFTDSIGDSITRMILSDTDVQNFQISDKSRYNNKGKTPIINDKYHLQGYTENVRPDQSRNYLNATYTANTLHSPGSTKVTRFDQDLRNDISQVNSRKEFNFGERRETDEPLKYDTDKLFINREYSIINSENNKSNMSILNKTNGIFKFNFYKILFFKWNNKIIIATTKSK